MGGILGAEVALLTPYSPTSHERFRHRILGTINFDTPFLGMHPGVIVSGIGSLFRPAPAPSKPKKRHDTRGENDSQPLPLPNGRKPELPVDSPPARSIPGKGSNSSGYFSSTSEMTVLDSNTSLEVPRKDLLSPLATPINDPNFNPPFQNDIRIPTRKGWDNTLHFIMKHSEGLTQATKSFVMSHLEFGGCLADYPGLKNRYTKIRALEDVNELQNTSSSISIRPKRVRFVNYYTASTGRIREDKAPLDVRDVDHPRQLNTDYSGRGEEIQDLSLAQNESRSFSNVSTHSLTQSQDDGNRTQRTHSVSAQSSLTEIVLDQELALDTNPEMGHIEPEPLTDESGAEPEEFAETNTGRIAASGGNMLSSGHDMTSRSFSLQLPPVPPSPTEPLPFDHSPYTNKDERKIAEKEHSRQVKAFQRAVKDRDKTIKERRKLVDKREKDDRQAREKRLKEEEKLRVKEEKDAIKRQIKSDELTTPSTASTYSCLGEGKVTNETVSRS